MSFEDHEDCFLWRCDQCGKLAVFKPHDFHDCVAELRARGWSFSPPERWGEDDWTHTCGYCRHKHKQTNIMDRTFKTVK